MMEKNLTQLPIDNIRNTYLINEEGEEKKRTESATQTNLNKTIKGLYTNVVQRNHLQFLREIIPKQRPKKRAVRFMDWNKYHRLDVIYSFMDDLEKDFPAICSVLEIGKSVEGRCIKMLKISNSDASNSPVWLDACIHSREWITTAVITYIADIIARNFRGLSKSITNKDWYFVPVLNPDGYEYTHTEDRMWRKNRAVYEGKCVGVDLNRNFRTLLKSFTEKLWQVDNSPDFKTIYKIKRDGSAWLSCGWGCNGDQGSLDDPTSVFYRGPSPFSEPETLAVRDTILSSRTPFKVFLSFHSYFELIIFPWGHKKDACPDYLNLLEGGAIMSRAIYESSGMIYKVGSTKDLTYCACGTSTDWSYTVANIPFSYMIELRSRKHKFRLPKDQIIGTGKEIWSAVQKLMEFVDGQKQRN